MLKLVKKKKSGEGLEHICIPVWKWAPQDHTNQHRVVEEQAGLILSPVLSELPLANIATGAASMNQSIFVEGKASQPAACSACGPAFAWD